MIINFLNNNTMKKDLEFYITYMLGDKKITERIFASSYREAETLCAKKGEFVGCEYIEKANDLIYLH